MRPRLEAMCMALALTVVGCARDHQLANGRCGGNYTAPMDGKVSL